jgi:hypothetical protein
MYPVSVVALCSIGFFLFLVIRVIPSGRPAEGVLENWFPRNLHGCLTFEYACEGGFAMEGHCSPKIDPAERYMSSRARNSLFHRLDQVRVRATQNSQSSVLRPRE